MLKKKQEQEVDVRKLNDVIHLSRKILGIAYFLLIILGVYGVIIVLKELQVLPFLKTLLTIVAPLFIGIVIAWLFDPIVTWLSKKGLKRGLGSFVVYAVFIGIIVLIIAMLIPLLTEQINEFASGLPGIFDTIQGWINGIFDRLSHIDGFDAVTLKADIFKQIEVFGSNLAQSLPTLTMNFLKSFFSGAGTFVIGLIIGFYLLVSFGRTNLISFLPKKMQRDTKALKEEARTSLRRFVQGAILDCSLVFVVTSLGFWLVGLKAPLLFGLFCGITNVIPYAGPYIGGAPAVIVGFSQGPLTGILVLLVIVVIQFIEGNFFQPLIMSKTTKLHPVTIILGLLIFGYFWGIIGMVVSTPLIAVTKAIFLFFDEKYHILDYNLKNVEEEE